MYGKCEYYERTVDVLSQSNGTFGSLFKIYEYINNHYVAYILLSSH